MITMAPSLMFMAAAVLLMVLPWSLRALPILGAPVLAQILVVTLPQGAVWELEWLGLTLTPLFKSPYALPFGTVFCLMAFIGGLFAMPRQSRMEAVAALFYAGGALGVVFCGDLLTLLLYWEVMAVAAAVIIWSHKTAYARAAGQRYAVMHLLGGAILMAGIAGEVMATGTATFATMEADSWSRWLILIGFLINVAAPPVSAWLPDAYPASSFSGMVFLSAFTTKTTVYVLIMGFPGEEVLLWAGCYMLLYGIVYAILENDVRRILAYSIVNQMGMMVAAVGIGTPLGLAAATAHAFTHVLYKATMIMSASSVMYMTGRTKCTELGGLFRTMPFTMVCGVIGSLSISAFPLFSGFVSKSLLGAAVYEADLSWVWFIFLAGTAGVFLHAGITWFVFFQKDSGLRPPEPPLSMRVAMAIGALACIVLGVAPGLLYAILPGTVAYEPYTADHVVLQIQLLLAAGLAFFLLLPVLKRTETISVDWDWLWRRGIPTLYGYVLREGSKGKEALKGTLVRQGGAAYEGLCGWVGTDGRLARSMTTSVMAFWALVMLAAYLIVDLLLS